MKIKCPMNSPYSIIPKITVKKITNIDVKSVELILEGSPTV